MAAVRSGRVKCQPSREYAKWRSVIFGIPASTLEPLSFGPGWRISNIPTINDS